MKTVDQALQSYEQGKYSAFWVLFEKTSEHIYSFLLEKTNGNTRLSEHLTQKAFERFLELPLSEKKELTEETFKELMKSLSESALSEYQSFSEFSTEKRDFKKEIKNGLSKSLDEKKAQNPRYFRFYLEHFRFYFTGFSIAVGIGLAAFLLGFLTFNKTPKIFSNPKLFTSTGTQAFPDIASILETSKEEKQTGSVFSNLPVITSMSGALKLFNEESYHISEKQIPKLPSSTLVAKQAENSQPEMSTWLKWLHLPALNLTPLKSATTTKLIFSLGTKDFDLDLAAARLNMKNNIEKSLARGLEISESALKKQIKNQISNLGLNLDHYGDLAIQSSSAYEITVFIPRLFNKLPIMDKNGLREGIYLRYAPASEQITSLENFSFQSYFISSYPINITLEKIFSKLAKQGIQKAEGKQETSLSLGNGTLAYQEKDGFLIPILTFSKDNGQAVIISLL
ncbi:MAG: hypothetical protein HG424_004605 [candidate division SR1 bacterium]|nr:hypothetical protein [candidate division SR1 bacterium]